MITLSDMSSQESSRPFRYLVTGGVAWVVDVLVFTICLTGLGVVLAQLCARLTGAAVAFIGHKVFVFGERRASRSIVLRQAVGYAALWVFSYAISTFALILLIEQAGVPALLSKALVELGVVTINYFVMKLLIFKSTSKRCQEP